MKKIKELQERLSLKNDFSERYSIEEDDKIHILYVNPKMNATGYYRMLSPMLEINKTITHKALISSIASYNFSEEFNENLGKLDERLVVWSDYIVFPSLFGNLTYFIKAIRALNPSLQLVMDVDKNYFLHSSKKLTKEKLRQFQKNLCMMDILFTHNKKLQYFLKRLLQDRLENTRTKVFEVPSLITRLGYQQMPALKHNTTKSLRVCLIKPTREALLSLKEMLLSAKKNYKEQIQFVCFSPPSDEKENGNKEVKELLTGIDCEIHKSVSFIKYFQKLHDLTLDIALLPIAELVSQSYQNHQLFLELSVFGIPTITSINHPAASFIEEGATGFLVEDTQQWLEALRIYFEDRELRKTMAISVIQSVWKSYSFTRERTSKFLEFFV